MPSPVPRASRRWIVKTIEELIIRDDIVTHLVLRDDPEYKFYRRSLTYARWELHIEFAVVQATITTKLRKIFSTFFKMFGGGS